MFTTRKVFTCSLSMTVQRRYHKCRSCCSRRWCRGTWRSRGRAPGWSCLDTVTRLPWCRPDTSHLTPETFPIRLTIKCQTWRHWQWNLLLMTPTLSRRRHPTNIENHILFQFPLLPNKLVTGPPPPLTRVWGLLGKIWLPWSNYPNYPPWP